MTHVLITPERAACLRQRLKKLLAERQAAKADFAAVCARLATEPRSSFGEFEMSFEAIEGRTLSPDFTETAERFRAEREARPLRDLPLRG